jgi:hypothetical protein
VQADTWWLESKVFAVASERVWFDKAKVILIGIEKLTTVRAKEGVGASVDATMDDLKLDVLLVPVC